MYHTVFPPANISKHIALLRIMKYPLLCTCVYFLLDFSIYFHVWEVWTVGVKMPMSWEEG